MRSVICLLVFILVSGPGFAGKAKDPLPDYIGQFRDLDTKIRMVDDSDPACTNYVWWVYDAVQCKKELKKWNDITPWLDELAGTYTNSWKIQHAVAFGYLENYQKSWKSVQCMDRAFRLARDKGADDAEIGQLCLDYIDFLLHRRPRYSLLRVKTPGVTETQYEADLESLWNVSITNPAGELIVCNLLDPPDWIEDYREWEKLTDPQGPHFTRIFFPLPDSYDSAANDGELIRWLIENRPSDGYGLFSGQRIWTMADFAVLIAGSHKGLPCEEDSILKRYTEIPSEEVRSILAALKDDETIIWGSDYVSNRVIRLPSDYCYIAEYARRAEQGDRVAAKTLGNIFVNRCQLERAAIYFELAEENEKVRSIRGNQGTFFEHSPYPEGISATLDFVYRNAEEVTFNIYPLTVETNLLARLITENMLGSELDLLCGEPETYQGTTQTNRFFITDVPIESWTHRLSPLPNHQDKIDSIQLPELAAGNYLLRAVIKGGTRVETVLHVYDTLLYSADYSIPGTDERKEGNLYILCDALTGRPLPKEDLHFFDLHGTAIRLGKKWVDCRYRVGRYERASTNKDGIHVSDQKTDWSTVLARLNNSLPFAVRKASAVFDVSDEAPYDYWRDEGYDESGVFMVSDRPLYRPGDTGYIKLWAPAGNTYYRPAVMLQKGKYEIPLTASNLDSSGRACWDAYGGTEFSFTIPSNAPLGEYVYVFPPRQNGRLWIEEYRAPEFDISASLTSNQTLEISAGYMYGKPVSDGELRFSFTYARRPQSDWYPDAPFDFLWGDGYWWNGGQFLAGPVEEGFTPSDCFTSCDTNLNASGQFVIDLLAEEDLLETLAIPGYFNVYATVTDAANRQFTKRIIIPNTFPERNLCCWMDKAFYEQGESLVCNIAFTDQSGPLHLNISAPTNEEPILSIPVSTEAFLPVEPLPPGVYQASLVSDTYSSRPYQFAVLGDTLASPADGPPIQLILEKGRYSAGETARLLVLVDQPGRYVYWFGRAGDPNGLSALPDVFQMDKTYTVLSLPLAEEDDAGILKSAAMTIVNGKHHMASTTIPVVGSGQVAGSLELRTEKTTYRPGENVTLSIRSADSAGEGMPSSVTVTVYNRSLDLLASDVQSPDILKTLFSNWVNHLHHSVGLTDPHRTRIRAIAPLWVMDLLMPQGSLPFRGVWFYTESCSMLGAALSAGGGVADDLEGLDLGSNMPSIREDFRDLAYWNASIETDSNGCASVNFPMPDGLVEWNIKAWAVHTNYAASATATLRCSKDFVMQLNTPRFIIEGDLLELSSSLRNHTTNCLDVKAACAESGAVIQIESAQEVSLHDVAPDRQMLLYWNVKAVKPGMGHITTTARSETSSDGMKKSIPVHPHGMVKRGGKGGILFDNSREQSVFIEMPQASEFDNAVLELNCSPDMLDALIGALPFLAEYPHGCTEQTLNRFLPAVVALQTMDELGVDILTKTNALPAGREALLDRHDIIARAQEGIDRLEDAQHYNGTWGWNLHDESSLRDHLITAWALRGLHRASAVEGLVVDNYTIQNPMGSLLDYMAEKLKPPPEGGRKSVSDIDAMLGCAVAEVGIREGIRYQKTKEEDQEVLSSFLAHLLAGADRLSLYGKLLLANAFDRQGDLASRDRIVGFAEQYLEHDPALGTYWLRTEGEGWWYWYNDHIETMAWYLKLLNRMEPNSAKTAGVVRYLMQNRMYGDHWKSTRDTAICIEALCGFIVNNRPQADDAAYQVLLNGNPVPISKSGSYAFNELRPGRNELVLQSRNGSPLFYDATWEYYTREKKITAEACDLVTISRAYYRNIPDSEGENDVPLQGGDIIQAGDTIEVELTLEASQPLEYLLAEDYKPAGFECLDALSGSGYGDGVRYYQELHDERISFYINRLSKGVASIRYKLRAEHAGTVHALPATVELMYAPRQAANSDEHILRIER